MRDQNKQIEVGDQAQPCFFKKYSPVECDDCTVHATQSKERKGVGGRQSTMEGAATIAPACRGLEKESWLGKENKATFVANVLREMSCGCTDND